MITGLITRHHIYHHGAVLQAYALQLTLHNLGHKVEIIDFRPLCHERMNWVFPFQNTSLIKNVSLKYFIGRAVTQIGWATLNIDNRIKRNNIYKSYIEKSFNLSKICYRDQSDLRNNPPEYDVYIAGSDQIWKLSDEVGGLEYSFFLDFAPSNKIRIAYAASFGKPVLPEKYAPELRNLLSTFNAISLREKSSVPFIQALTNTSIVNVLDPALLLERNNWDEIVQTPSVPEKYLFVYSVTWNRNLSKFAKHAAKKTGLKMVCIGPDYTKFGLRDSVCGPAEFIGYIKNATLVVTDSFHGTVFSIQYEKQFYSYPPKGEETRISDLLTLLHLEGRFVSSADDTIETDANIDYASVNAILSEQRELSLNFLTTALKEKSEGT